jgi:ketosteroid isomerase-like protein
MAATTDVNTRVRSLLDYIRQGRILEAMEEFYDEDVAMQENRKEPCVGLAKNIEREKEFLAQVKDFKSFEAKAVGVDGDTALVESFMEFVNQQDQPVRLEQVSVTRWKDGKIVHERFYYDSAG